MLPEDIKFEPLPMRKRTLIAVSANQYSIKSKSGDVTQIEANTAYEAFKLAGVKDAIQIIRTSNTMHMIVSNKQFTDENVQVVNPQDEDTFEQIKRRKTPIISADDLDVIMRGLQANLEDIAIEPEMPVYEQTGKEVHNDGFDEIIPASITPKPVVKPAPQPVEPEVTVAAPAQMPQPPEEQHVQPEQALSQEEIEKLLNGN